MIPSQKMPVRFAALTVEKGRPLPHVTIDGKPRRQKQLKREMDAVTQIFQNWAAERKAEIDKITAGRDIRLKVITREEFDGAYTSKEEKKRWRTLSLDYGATQALAAYIGAKLYEVSPDGKQTRLQIRWPGQTNPDGPLAPSAMQDWAEKYILAPRNLFNALTKALKNGVANIGVENKYTYEDNT